MGIETDQEIVQLVGSESLYADALSASLEAAAKLNINSQEQALEFVGNKIKPSKRPGSASRNRVSMFIFRVYSFFDFSFFFSSM